MARTWRWTKASGAPARADAAITEALASGLGVWEPDAPDGVPSRSQIQKAIEEGRARVDGQALKQSTKLGPGACVELHFPDPRPLDLRPENRAIEILFEDSHLAVINKPAGLTVHPSTTQTEGTLVHALLHQIRDLSGIGGALRPGIVHRLDKDTSGVMVISKSDAAHAGLVKIFSSHDIERRYWAICYGIPKNKSFKVEGKIGRNPADRKKMALGVKTGRESMTHFRVLETYGKFASLIEAELETGRTHQVRVHLTAAGNSVLGDPVYGTPTSRQSKWTALPEEIQAAIARLEGQALHARVLGFTHPITGKTLRFEAEPPEAFSLLLQALRRYS